MSDMGNAIIAAAKRKGGFPHFRSRYDPHQTVSFAQGVKVIGDTIKVPSIDTPLRVAGSTRRLRWFLDNANGTIKRATLSRNGVHRPWCLSVVIEIDIPYVTAPDDRPVVGLDLGIKVFATLSDGTIIKNPRILQGTLRRLRRAQKSASRSEQQRKVREADLRAAGRLGASARIAKSHRHLAKEQVISRIYARVVALRNEFHHEVANMLISRYRAIGIEDLNIAGMARNKRGKMSRHITDVAWGSFLTILRYKADAAGVEIVEAGRWFASSQRCSDCGVINPAVKDLAVRIWACPSCGVIHDRDVNAATNLYPNESRIAAARTIRLTEREMSAKKRRSQKARAVKSAATKLINSEAARLAKHEEKTARAAGRRQSKTKSKTLTVTPTDSKARRGLVRPKEMTVVVSAARVAQATPMAQTVNPSDREEAQIFVSAARSPNQAG